MRSLEGVSHDITSGDSLSKLLNYLRGFNSTWLSAKLSPLEHLNPREAFAEIWYQLELYLASRSSLEYTSFLLTILAFLALSMSWSSRFGSWGGRFSPFGRNPAPGSTEVNDADYSYITSEDLKRAQDRSPSPVESGPSRDRDVLVLKNKRVSYPLHFPAYSVSRGEVRIGDVRSQAARVTNTSDAQRIKLLYKGKNLRDDSKTCRAEGLREGAEIMCVVGDAVPEPSSSSDSEEEDQPTTTTDGDAAPKRKRNRNKKGKKKGKKSAGASAPAQELPSTPATPLDKLNAISHILQGLLPQCVQFTTNPPTEPAKKEYEHKRLSETILAQVLLKLDAVDTEGDPDARVRRKELVREAQNILTGLDEANK